MYIIFIYYIIYTLLVYICNSAYVSVVFTKLQLGLQSFSRYRQDSAINGGGWVQVTGGGGGGVFICVRFDIAGGVWPTSAARAETFLGSFTVHILISGAHPVPVTAQHTLDESLLSQHEQSSLQEG